MESLNFVRCENTSVIVVELPESVTSNSSAVSFMNVGFSENRNFGGRGALRAVSHTGDRFCSSHPINVENCTFSNNRAKKGAAIYVKNVHLNIRNSRFIENHAYRSGGAISFESKCRDPNALTIKNSSFIGNLAVSRLAVAEGDDLTEDLAGRGGAIAAINPRNTSFQDVRFVNNTSCGGGGALYVRMIETEEQRNPTADFQIERSLFEGNGAYCMATPRAELRNPRDHNHYAGGAFLYRSTVYLQMHWIVRNTRFTRNRAVYGGAMQVSGQPETPLNLVDSLLEENGALQRGGAICIPGAQLKMRGSTLRRNAALVGGGIAVLLGGRLITLPHPSNHSLVSIVEENSAYYGGGIGIFVTGLLDNTSYPSAFLCPASDTMDLRSLTVRNNTAFHYGGGIRVFAISTMVYFRGITVEGNRAMAGGGFAFTSSPIAHFESADGKAMHVANNLAAVGGGLLFEIGHYVPINITVSCSQRRRSVQNRSCRLRKP